MKKQWTFWGGFSEGHLHVDYVNDGWGGFDAEHLSLRPALFRTRKEAREQYCDVRKVIVTEVRP
jgi:hypothetical protein